MDLNSPDMRFHLLKTSISSPETLLKFRSEDRTWNHGNRRNQKSVPTYGATFMLVGIVKLPMHYNNVTLWIKGCDHGASSTRGISLDVMLLINVRYL